MLDKFNIVFSKRLIHYMDLYRMSQKDLAQRVGVSEATISNWVKGVKSPRVDKVDKLCIIFNCKRSDLVENSNTPPVSPLVNEIMENAASLSEAEQQEVLSFARFLVSKHKEP